MSDQPEREVFVPTGGSGPPDAFFQQFRAMEGPLGPGNQARGVIAAVWRSLPQEQRTVERVEAEVRRLMERALQGFKEDYAAFDFR